MKSTYVDPTTGDVVCPVCGARNQFTVKRTAKAKWMAVPTVGVGVLAMPKRLSCNGCGTNLKRGGSSAVPGTPQDAKNQSRSSNPENVSNFSCGVVLVGVLGVVVWIVWVIAAPAGGVPGAVNGVGLIGVVLVLGGLALVNSEAG